MITQNNGFYRELLDNLNEGVYFVDKNRRITYWNKAAERLTGYKSAEVIGHRCAENILMHVDCHGTQLCVNGCPLSGAMEDGTPRHASIYMLHKDGHRIPVTVAASTMRDEKGEITGAVESFSDNSTVVALNERLNDLSQTTLIDKLTGVGNRRFADATLEEKFGELHRYKWSFGVVFCDVDAFKSVNDKYGHETGDRCLKMIARTLTGALRGVDSVFRWGGDEFLAVITNVDMNQLEETAIRLKMLVASSALPTAAGSLRLNISAGCSVAEDDDDQKSLIARTDAMMYKDKASRATPPRIL